MLEEIGGKVTDAAPAHISTRWDVLDKRDIRILRKI